VGRWGARSPGCREGGTGAVAGSGGDLSGWFANHPRDLSQAETDLLTGILRPAKRETLTRLWRAAVAANPKVGELDWREVGPPLGLLS